MHNEFLQNTIHVIAANFFGIMVNTCSLNSVLHYKIIHVVIISAVSRGVANFLVHYSDILFHLN